MRFRQSQTAVGGRCGARRLNAIIAAFVIACVPRPATAGSDDARVAVREERGAYTVSASFDVSQPVSTVLGVLTDYERIPSFMPAVKTSAVRQRFPGGVVVEQEALSRLMMFSKRVHLVLEVHERSDSIRFQDLCGRSFVRYAGAWQLARVEGRTAITYELTAQPSFDVPEFLLRRLLKRDAKQMIDLLRTEIAARFLREKGSSSVEH